MCTIKDVYGLIEKLHQSTKYKRILELLLPIEQKLLEAEKENFATQKEHNNLVADIKSQHDKEMFDLKFELKQLKDKKLFQGGFRIDRK